MTTSCIAIPFAVALRNTEPSSESPTTSTVAAASSTPGPSVDWLGGITERAELGRRVACTAFHPPGVLARMAAATHELSGGRLVLGLGCGWNEVEFRAFGLPFDHLVSRFEEAFTIVRGLLAGERVSVRLT